MRIVDADELIYDMEKQSYMDSQPRAIRRAIKMVANAPTVEIDESVIQEVLNKRNMTAVANEYLIALHGKRTEGEWIPITEKLPNTLGVYNVTRKLKEGETIYFISDASYFDGQNTWYADTGINHSRPYLTDITAWRPLPEPYKKGEGE